MEKASERLILRDFAIDDITSEYIEALNDKEVVKYTEARHKIWNMENAKDFVLESKSEKTELIGIFLADSNKHIGNIRLHFSKIHKRAALGIMVWDKKAWGRGYGTEALDMASDYVFNDLGCHKLWADYYEENAASAKMFKKAGFKIEGVLKDHFVLDGRFVNDVCVAKLNKNET